MHGGEELLAKRAVPGNEQGGTCSPGEVFQLRGQGEVFQLTGDRQQPLGAREARLLAVGLGTSALRGSKGQALKAGGGALRAGSGALRAGGGALRACVFAYS